MAIEGGYGYSYDRPARHMREYLDALVPLLRDGAVDVQGETITARGRLTIPDATAPTLLLAALQPRMLALAGGVADGTITWCTGPVVLEEQVVPLITAAAGAAGRPLPAWSWSRCRPSSPTTKPTVALRPASNSRATATSPSTAPCSTSTVPPDLPTSRSWATRRRSPRNSNGSPTIGATDFIAIPTGNDADRRRTLDHLATLVD